MRTASQRFFSVYGEDVFPNGNAAIHLNVGCGMKNQPQSGPMCTVYKKTSAPFDSWDITD